MRDTAFQKTLMVCLDCNRMGAVTWVRDYVLMTNRKVVLAVDEEFIKVGNEVYCGNCLVACVGQAPAPV